MAQNIANTDTPLYTPVAGRTGVSPIGTTSPNTGATAATNSSYSVGAFASGINLQGATTAYTLQNTDYQGVIIFNTTSAIAITLNSALATNFTCIILNVGGGAITLTPMSTPAVYPVNGAGSITLPAGAGCSVFFAARAWWAYVGVTVVQVVPANTPAVAGEYLTGYNSTTGAFTLSTPAGLSITIATAKLTTGGSNGSMTFVGGLLSAQVQAT